MASMSGSKKCALKPKRNLILAPLKVVWTAPANDTLHPLLLLFFSLIIFFFCLFSSHSRVTVDSDHIDPVLLPWFFLPLSLYTPCARPGAIRRSPSVLYTQKHTGAWFPQPSLSLLLIFILAIQFGCVCVCCIIWVIAETAKHAIKGFRWIIRWHSSSTW